MGNGHVLRVLNFNHYTIFEHWGKNEDIVEY